MADPLGGPPISDRVHRALRQDLRLLHRSHSTFFILGATRNVYTITLSTFPSCSCPDPVTPCKHILFVLIRVLGVPPDNVFLLQRIFYPSELRRLLNQPTSPAALADAVLRRRFHQLFFDRKQGQCSSGDGISCPICFDEMKKGEKILACGTCRNLIHEKCFLKWKGSKGGRVRCVKCRAPWKKKDCYQHVYLNLSGYTLE